MFGLGMGELLVILFIILLLFGAQKLPEIAKALGKSLNSFKKGLKDINDEMTDNKESENKGKVKK